MSAEQIHFVTGRLAEFALRGVLKELAAKVGFDFTVQVMPITVAALMTPQWVAKHLEIPEGTHRIILPGFCQGDLSALHELTDLPIEVGPKDLRMLPKHFGKKSALDESYGKYDIEIIAEINHAPRMELDQILRLANEYRDAGADLIDVGCIPNFTWTNIDDCVKALKDDGFRVSVDSLNPDEIAIAAKAGAELVLSVNSTNRNAALDWGVEVVVIPDEFENLGGLSETIEFLAGAGVPMRIDPILEPIGCGFTKSLLRYAKVRNDYPDAEMMMGIGNLTELSDVDSAGINLLLLGVCQELGVRSVLTTQVINWCRSSVRECDAARRLVYHSIEQGIPPKNVDRNLVMLRDTEIVNFSQAEIAKLSREIRDSNYRIFVEEKTVHLIGGGYHFHATDPFVIFDLLADENPKNLDPSHAFYLGYEMCKAMTAANLGKQYNQDQALDWGFLTQAEEDRHRLEKSVERKRRERRSSQE